MQPDALTAQLLASLSHLAESRAAGIPARDAARAMATERRNAKAQAEELFGARRPS